MYFGILTVVIWLTFAPQLIIDVGVSVNGQLLQKTLGVLKTKSEYDEDGEFDDIGDGEGNEGVTEHRSMMTPRTTRNFTGIYGTCKEKLNKFTFVVAQGGCVLVYDPLYNPYGCANVGLMTSGCEKKDSGGLCVGKYKTNWCFEATEGWYWFWGSIRMAKIQYYKFFRQPTETLFYREKRKNAGGFPPVPSDVQTVLNPGRIDVYIKGPKFEEGPRLALGYRVSLLDKGLGEVWDVQTNLESVVYRCEFPELKPIHPCTMYRKDKSFCVLVTEPVFWTNYKAATGLKYIKVETYFLPQFQKNRWYSQPYIVIPETPVQPVHMGPMFGVGNTTYPRNPPSGAHSYGHPWLILCLVLGVLILFCLFGGIPLVIYWSTRAAQREAEEQWRLWAESPGNVGVGLGTDPVAWYGNPPWTVRPKTTEA